ncbi:MAG: type II secretion system F family protein, partial [Halothiobacillus sp.]|nr:type II secretion system F family protein [Halothiobacillus sp.]
MAVATSAKKTKKDEKTVFVYDSKNKDGKLVKGEMSAHNEMVVRAEVRRLGLTVIRVKKKPKPLFSNTKGISPRDIAIFARQLSTMMNAGLPIVQALDIMAQSAEKVAMKELVANVKNDVESGLTLANALDQHRNYFEELFVNLVRAGEDSGSLELVLDRIAIYKEKTESLKGKIKKALFYPIAVVVVAFIVTAILLIFVIPQFKQLFDGFGATLPAFTLFVVGISEAFQKYWYVIFGGIGVAIFLFAYVKQRSDAFNHFLDRMILKMPIFGPLTEKAAIARFARTLGTMFS